MSDINWKDGAICFAYNKQWFVRDDDYNDLISADQAGFASSNNAVVRGDFKLNEIREGDFIPASELDTEQKYNEVVEVFGLFGFEKWEYSKGFANLKPRTHLGIDKDGEILAISTSEKRQLTYSQIIAIGKLKLMMLERERSKGGYVDEIPIPDNRSEFDEIVSSKSIGISKPNKSVNVVMTNKTAAIKVLEAIGMDASFVQSVSINGKEVFNIENADDITTVTVSKYVKKT